MLKFEKKNWDWIFIFDAERRRKVVSMRFNQSAKKRSTKLSNAIFNRVKKIRTEVDWKLCHAHYAIPTIFLFDALFSLPHLAQHDAAVDCRFTSIHGASANMLLPRWHCCRMSFEYITLFFVAIIFLLSHTRTSSGTSCRHGVFPFNRFWVVYLQEEFMSYHVTGLIHSVYKG